MKKALMGLLILSSLSALGYDDKKPCLVSVPYDQAALDYFDVEAFSFISLDRLLTKLNIKIVDATKSDFQITKKEVKFKDKAWLSGKEHTYLQRTLIASDREFEYETLRLTGGESMQPIGPIYALKSALRYISKENNCNQK